MNVYVTNKNVKSLGYIDKFMVAESLIAKIKTAN
jgi:hypothetical protein